MTSLAARIDSDLEIDDVVGGDEDAGCVQVKPAAA